MFMLDDSSKYLTLYAHEYYYIDGVNGSSGKYPGGYILYYDNPDVATNMDINDFTYNLRPMVKYKYQEGAAYFVALGVDGKAPVDSKVVMNIKDFKTKEMFAYDNFYNYPNYPDIIDVPNKWTTLESNYQTDEFIDGFEKNKVYEIEFIAYKDNQESNKKKTWFLLYEVKGFDLINNIATFYGVDVKTLIEDNNLNDELITEGNLLFIREPKRNIDKEYKSEDLTLDEKLKIDASLKGRNIQCEYGFEPINFNTGSFLIESVDFSFITNGKTYDFIRTYDSKNSEIISQMGQGQTYNGYSYVVKNNEYAQVKMFDGKTYLYKKDVNGNYINDINNLYKLEYINDHFELYNNEERYVYDNLGYISKVIDKNNNETSFIYDNRNLIKIIFSDNKEIKFNYNNENLISKIELPNNKFVSYEYDDNLNLIKFIDELNYITTYNYDNNHNIISWYNKDNILVVENTYDNHKVTYQKTH